MKPLSAKRKNGKWVVDTGRLLPARVRKSFDYKAQAEAFIDSIVTPVGADEARARAMIGPPLTETVNEYIRWAESTGQKTKETITRDRGRLRVLVEWSAARGDIINVTDITFNALSQFQTHFFETPTFSKTAKAIHRKRAKKDPRVSKKRNWLRYRETISAFLNWCIRRGYAVKNPAADQEFKYSLPQNIPDRFTPAELRAIFAYFDERDSGQPVPFFSIYFRFIAYTGIRPGRETYLIKWEDIDIEKRIIFVKETKTGMPRTVEIHKRLIRYLERLPKDSDWLFCDRYGKPYYSDSWLLRQLHAACDALGMPRRRVYDLRHSFGSNLAEKNVSLAKIQRLMGHRNIQTTMRYIHFYPDDIKGTVNELDY